MKKFIIFIFSVFISCQIVAQQDPQFSQYVFNNLSFNPGFTGSQQAICATALHRSQWMGFEGAPVSTNLSIESPVTLLNGGLGLNVLTDKIAQQEFLGINLSYAYRIELAGGNLGVGLSVGVLQDGVDVSSIVTQTQSDPNIPSSSDKASSFDLGLGLYYNSDKMYVGLSSKHLNEPTISSGSNIINIKRHYYLTAGYLHEINTSFLLKPSLLLRSEGVTTSIDLTSLVEYNNRLWGGVSYRVLDRAVILMGLHINEDLKFGVSYDLPISAVSASGSLEFMLGYCFKIDYNKVVKGFKNPRFL